MANTTVEVKSLGDPFTHLDSNNFRDSINTKQDQEAGKGLSTNDFTDTLRNKLLAVEQVYTQTEKDKLASLSNGGGGGGGGEAIVAGSTGSFYSWDKTWRDFRTYLSSTVLTGYALGTNAVLAATDTVYQAFGKLQAQINGKEPAIGVGALADNKLSVNVPIKVSGKIVEADLPSFDLLTAVDLAQFAADGSNKLHIRDEFLLEQFSKRGYGRYEANIGTATITSRNVATGTPASTSARQYDFTTYLGSIQRVGVITNAATAGASGSFRGLAGFLAFKMGFRVRFEFCVTDVATVGEGVSFIGFSSNLSVLTASFNPFTYNQNFFGIGNNIGDPNFSIYINNGSTNSSKTSLGANFPANTLSADVYEVLFYAPANGTSLTYTVRRRNATTGAIVGSDVTNTLSAQVPAPTVALAIQIVKNNNGTALQSAMEISSIEFNSRLS